MSETVKTFAPPLTSSFPFNITTGSAQLGGLTAVQTIEVDNGSNLTLSVFGDGQLIRTLSPYVSRWNINTSGGWQDITITANTAAIQATDQITIIAYDTVVPVLFPPSFGVSSWGAGAIPNQLVSIAPGNSILAWQLQQFVNLFTGVMTGQIVLVGNEVQSTGPNADFKFFDRDGVGSDSFTWYANAGMARLLSSVGNQDRVTVSETGRLSAPLTGASAKPLFNSVANTPPTTTTINGTGAAAITAVTVTGLPASATMADLWVSITSGVGTGAAQILDGSSHQVLATASIVSGGTQVTGGRVPVTTGATNQLQYSTSGFSGAQAWTLSIQLNGWEEPS